MMPVVVRNSGFPAAAAAAALEDDSALASSSSSSLSESPEADVLEAVGMMMDEATEEKT